LSLRSHGPINEQLHPLHRHWRRRLVGQITIAGLGAAGLTVGLAVVLAHHGYIQGGLKAGALLFGVSLAVAFYFGRRPFASLGALRVQLARLAEELAPELGSSATSAVSFSRPGIKLPQNASSDLIAEHLRQTREQLSGVDFDERLSQRFRQSRQYTWAFGVLGLLIGALLFNTLERGRTRLLRAVLHPNAVQISETPLTGDIQLRYQYPAYTGLGVQHVEGGNGSVRALIGTEVEITATADHDVKAAHVEQIFPGATPPRTIPMTVQGGRELKAHFSVMTSSRYSFSLHTVAGEHLEERRRHPIVAIADTYPEIQFDSPLGDVELRDNDSVPVIWHAKDDYGVGQVNLVIEPDAVEPGADSLPTAPIRIPLGLEDQLEKRREGRFSWSLASLQLAPGQGAKFYLEAIDNDTVTGPKRSVSTAHRLQIFSARKHHEKVLASQGKVLNALVDWLALDLTQPVKTKDALTPPELQLQENTLQHLRHVQELIAQLAQDIRDDELSREGIITAFTTVLAHTNEALSRREPLLKRLRTSKPPTATQGSLRNVQRAAVEQLEKDIIYLDDLLAIQRIDELKQTAQDLLSAQRELQGLLQTYRETKNPNLREALEQQIQQLRNQMLELLQKMSQIKKHLPGEYRNMEASSMNKIDDQLGRLEEMLESDDLEGAAQELEQLANMIEQMMDSIDDAESEYGGERYEAIRQELNEFSQSFQELERQQEALSKRTDELLKDYRKKALKNAGDDKDAFAQKVRELTAKALLALDPVAASPLPVHDPGRSLENARQRLLDLDALMEQQDFAEARVMGQQSQRSAQTYQQRLQQHMKRYGERITPEMTKATASMGSATKAIAAVKEELDKLFPEPKEVLNPDQMQQMQRMAQKQQELRDQASELGSKMNALAQEVPLFGGEPQTNLQNARSEMNQAQRRLKSGKLPGASTHERRALDQLGKLRQALEEAAQGGGKGGFPMPLGQSPKPGGQKSGSSGFSQKDVEIPQVRSNKGAPRFRQELLDAAKQKAPQRYEEAVRQYYEELIK
jgi:hypothetical protein